MGFKRRLRLAAVMALIGIAGHGALAQTTSMETRQGSRHTGPGTVAASSSTFAVGITKDNGATFVDTATVSETVEIRGEVRPEAANVGQTGDIFLVDRVIDDNGGHISFSMRDQSGVWLPWNGTVSILVPFIDNTTLAANMPLTLFSGTLGTAGNHRIFIGYMATSDGILRYHTSGLPLTITAAQTQSPSVQAQALFETKINPNIVQTACIACHVQGGQAGNVHTFEFGTSSSIASINYNVFLGLEHFGKAFLMQYVASSNTNHPGGQQVVGAQNIADFDQFLTLLGQF